MKFTVDDVGRVAELAQVKISAGQAKSLAKEFDESMQVVDELLKIDTDGVEPTYQVNQLTNVWREDEVDEQSMLTQKQALQNAARTYNGYFMVERIIDHDA